MTMRVVRLSFLAIVAAVAVVAACDAFSSDDSSPAPGVDASTIDAATPDAGPDVSSSDGGSDAPPTPRCGSPASSGVFFCDDFEGDAGRKFLAINGAATVVGGVLASEVTSPLDGGALSLAQYDFTVGAAAWKKVRITSDVTLTDLAVANDASIGGGALGASLFSVMDGNADPYTVSVAALTDTPSGDWKLWVFAKTDSASASATYSSAASIKGSTRRVTLEIDYGAPAGKAFSLRVDGADVELKDVGVPTFPGFGSTPSLRASIGLFVGSPSIAAKTRYDNLEIETRP